MTNPLKTVKELGQSIWYDNLSRELLNSGELARLIEEDGISGVTSNPTIFEKAINSQRIYDNDVHALVDEGRDRFGIYEGLVTADVRHAADLLIPIYEETAGVDGYVSLEVSPALAYDAPGTVEQARHLFDTVGRPNLMIKVPATGPGFIAVEELIALGINVNVTLMFSLQQYEATAQAYIRGLERLMESEGDPARVASVASFFVSRVDTMVDQRLQEVTDPAFRNEVKDLLGKAAIANARLAYARFKELFLGPDFDKLRSRGARPQRLLWASTSTKNPEYPDTYYVDALIGPLTVNTLPPETLDAYRDHGTPEVRIEDDLEEARKVFPLLDEMGTDTADVFTRLLRNGVEAFSASFDKLIEGIDNKRTRFIRGWGHRSASLGDLREKVESAMKQWDSDRLTEKIWTGDTSIWTEHSAEPSDIHRRLGWLTVHETMTDEIPRIMEFVDGVRNAGFTSAVLLGMGGSSLAAEAFRSCFGVREGYLDLKVLDSTVPEMVSACREQTDMSRTLFITASKSGTTIEAMALFKYFWDKAQRELPDTAGDHFVAITDPGTPLGEMASKLGFRRTFLNPPDIGGRFSALSYFGLIPAALIGVDLDYFLMRASQAAESAGPDVPSIENPSVWGGLILAIASLEGIDKLTLLISPPLAAFGNWVEQLLAESTGKQGKGILPIVGEPLGEIEQYGKDRLFTYLRLDEDSTYDSFISGMEQRGFPVVTLRLHTAYDIGREIFRWEFATAMAGAILEINPFNQPNVQESKDLTRKLLELYEIENTLPPGEFVTENPEDAGPRIRELLGTVKPGDYVAFNVFTAPTEPVMEILTEMRVHIRNRFGIATTLGFGPRYLHSTGQFHKGGPANGLFILITSDDEEDVLVPGEAYSFSVLKTAQAIGDYEALTRRGRRALRIHLASPDGLAGIRDVIQSL